MAGKGNPVEFSTAIGFQRGNPDVPARRFAIGSPAGASGRTLLAPQGPWRMVDPERRSVCRRRCRGRRRQGVRGGDGRCSHRAARTAWRDSPAWRQAGGRIRGRRRSRRRRPRGSARMQTFPEIDRAEWFDLAAAHPKILDGQRPFLDRLAELVGRPERRPA